MFKQAFNDGLNLTEASVQGQRLSLKGVSRQFLVSSGSALSAWFGRWKERRQLLALDDRLLKDAGITRYDAITEAAKPFWRW